MKKLIALFAAVLLSSSAYAGETELKKMLQSNYPQIGKISQVNKANILGLYEVVADGHLFYTDAKGQYLIVGNIYELTSMRNLTEERSRKVSAVDFNKLPLDIAIKRVKGDGSRRMAYFTDPSCGYCRKLERELSKIDNVTLYMFIGPIFGGPASEDVIRNIKCAKDPVKAWDELMLNGNAPASSSCDTKTDKVMALAKKMGVNGTPNLIFGNGEQNPGYMPAEELEKRLNASRKQ